jgi:protein-S-isoprenylcysteine O-methyltransferase Ste14
MKARNLKDYNSNWIQTVVSIVGLLFVILVSFGVITPEQSAEAQPLIASTLGAVSSVIAGVIAITGIFFKNSQ